MIDEEGEIRKINGLFQLFKLFQKEFCVRLIELIVEPVTGD